MYRAPAPIKRYTVSGVGALTRPAAWLVEQFAATADWWREVPWGSITLFFVALLFGQFVADCTNPRSYMRQRWREWRRLFVVEKITTLKRQSETEDFLQVVARIRFVKPVRDARLVIHMYGLIFDATPRQRTTWVLGEGMTCNAGEERGFVIASLSGKGHAYSGWGEQSESDVAARPLEGSQNIVVIEVSAGRRRQRHKIRLDFPWTESHAFGRVYWIEETDEPFALFSEV